jgi:threonine synthase
MDIQVSSNIERFFYFISNDDGARVRDWMATFHATGRVAFDDVTMERARADLMSACADESDTLAAMQTHLDAHHYLLDPHTAVGVHACNRLVSAAPRRCLTVATTHRASHRQAAQLPASAIVICLATAHPAKFADAVGLVRGGAAALVTPPSIATLASLPTRSERITAHATAVRERILREETV